VIERTMRFFLTFANPRITVIEGQKDSAKVGFSKVRSNLSIRGGMSRSKIPRLWLW
jgi:hypothetical protein